MRALCARYAHLNHPKPEDFDDIFRFLLDFICIHPMEDANGRLSVLKVFPGFVEDPGKYTVFSGRRTEKEQAETLPLIDYLIILNPYAEGRRTPS